MHRMDASTSIAWNPPMQCVHVACRMAPRSRATSYYCWSCKMGVLLDSCSRHQLVDSAMTLHAGTSKAIPHEGVRLGIGMKTCMLWRNVRGGDSHMLSCC